MIGQAITYRSIRGDFWLAKIVGTHPCGELFDIEIPSGVGNPLLLHKVAIEDDRVAKGRIVRSSLQGSK